MADENVQAATQADKEPGRALQAGDYDRAWSLLQEARDLDQTRAGLWDAHERRLMFAESQARPLAELVAARTTRAGFEPDDPAIRNWAEHNASLRDSEMGA
jgi:hypothetical protein